VKVLGLTVAGLWAGLGAYVVFNLLAPRHAMGRYATEGHNERDGSLGSKERISGAGRRFAGQVKDNVGRIIGDGDLTGEGVADQVTGAAKDVAANLPRAVSSDQTRPQALA
jgi:uncharacterized protein YjbJ (UPF0337 family)